MTPQEMEAAIARLFEGQDMLTGKVAELTDDVTALSHVLRGMREEAEADRKFQREALERVQAQADADRHVQRTAVEEMRAAVSTMLEIAESMASNVTLLTQAQHGTTNRISRLEIRVDHIERNIGSSENESNE